MAPKSDVEFITAFPKIWHGARPKTHPDLYSLEMQKRARLHSGLKQPKLAP